MFSNLLSKKRLRKLEQDWEPLLAALDKLETLESVDAGETFERYYNAISSEETSVTADMVLFLIRVLHKKLGMHYDATTVLSALILAEGKTIEVSEQYSTDSIEILAVLILLLKHEYVDYAFYNEVDPEKSIAPFAAAMDVFKISYFDCDKDRNVDVPGGNKSYRFAFGSLVSLSMARLKQELDKEKRGEYRISNAAIISRPDQIITEFGQMRAIISAHKELKASFYEDTHKISEALGDDNFALNKEHNVLVPIKAEVQKASKLILSSGILEKYKPDVDMNICLQSVFSHLKAEKYFPLGFEYVVDNGKVVVRDPKTDKLIPERRYSEGLQQALEYKEGVEISPISEVVAWKSFTAAIKSYSVRGGVLNLKGLSGSKRNNILQHFDHFGSVDSH